MEFDPAKAIGTFWTTKGQKKEVSSLVVLCQNAT
jgi:hypothetical protein